MAAVFTIGLLAAAWLGWAVLGGLGFVAGCVLAARYTRTADLLTVVVCPPALFLAVVVFVTLVTGSGGFFLAAVGSVVTLADAAPWLAIGMALTVAIAWARGLPRCIQDLRRELRASPPLAWRRPGPVREEHSPDDGAGVGAERGSARSGGGRGAGASAERGRAPSAGGRQAGAGKAERRGRKNRAPGPEKQSARAGKTERGGRKNSVLTGAKTGRPPR